MEHYSIADARRNLSRLVRAVERGVAVGLTRRGKQVAVLISTSSYARHTGSEGRFGRNYDAFVADHDLDAIGIEPQTFEQVRDESPGRQVSL